MSLKDKIGAVRNDFRTAIENISNNPNKLEEVRVKFLGRKGEVAKLFSTMETIAPEDRAEAGKLFNKLKDELQSLFNSAVKNVTQNQEQNKSDYIDYTLP